MAMNLYIDSLPDITVNMSTELDSYIIDAASSTTYDYNLPSITTNGQRYTLTRIDGSTGVVNLNGTMNINGTSISSFKIFPLSTVSVVSLDGVWYIVCSESTSPELSNLVFSTYLNTDIDTPYVSFPIGNTLVVTFPFLGRNNYATISRFVVVFGIPTTEVGLLHLRNAPNTFNCFINVPMGITTLVTDLSASQKNAIPLDITYLRVVTGGGASVSNMSISSIHIYA